MRKVFMLTTALTATGATAQEVAPVELPPITLESALRDTRDIRDTPVAASVLEGEALEQRQADTYEELIGDIPGVVIEGGPRGISQEPNIRGFQDEQVVLRFDGGRLNFNQAHRGRFFFDPDIVQRVEVVRGGGSTLFGSGALGGVISVETRDPSDLLRPGQTTGARVRLGYASNGDIFSGSTTVYGDWGNLDALAFIGTRQFGSDLDDGNGRDIRNSELDATNGLFKLGFEPAEDQRFEFTWSHYRDDGTTPPNANAASSEDDVDRDAEISTARLSWDFNPEGSNLVDLSVLLYGNTLRIEEDRTRDGRADVTDYDTYGLEITNRSSFDWGIPVALVYGAEIYRDDQNGTRNGTDRLQLPDATAETTGVFAEASFGVSDQLDLIAGLRFDSYSRDVDDPTLADVDEDFLSPRVGFSYRPNDRWQIFGNVAQAYRAPTLTELYNDGVHFTSPGFPIGGGITFSGVNQFVPNPNLEEEESIQYELGFRFEDTGVRTSGDTLRFSANAYYAEVDNFIESRVEFIDFSTLVFGPGGGVVGGTTTQRNVDARLWGVEAELDYDAGLWFAGVGLSIPRGETVGGDRLGSIPQERITGTLGWRPNQTWTVGARATYAASVDDGSGGNEPADSYALLDLFATLTPTRGAWDGTALRVGVDNLFDEQYTIFPNGLSQPGRSFKVSLTQTFCPFVTHRPSLRRHHWPRCAHVQAGHTLSA
ncbi:TonB-dependent hemoglobin/transferrin/lactoferrin family receptor [Roseobacter denitrificans]|nr:TonB-dependent hemoglobin/transferrin/lactoferrin family receptor [Roseobacter denitrificans]SFG03359.1 hemoglobin/transferrin/lactoferrin receptor protein [Roseobacter denitrificans OCh 114]